MADKQRTWKEKIIRALFAAHDAGHTDIAVAVPGSKEALWLHTAMIDMWPDDMGSLTRRHWECDGKAFTLKVYGDATVGRAFEHIVLLLRCHELHRPRLDEWVGCCLRTKLRPGAVLEVIEA